jgi:hypothetical protein
MPNSQRLMIIANTVHTVGHRRVNPSVYFNPIAHPVSNSPARNKMTHAIGNSFL